MSRFRIAQSDLCQRVEFAQPMWIVIMLGIFFESRKRKERDASELWAMRIAHGTDLKTVLWQRANDAQLAQRDRRHWQRLLKKADRLTA